MHGGTHLPIVHALRVHRVAEKSKWKEKEEINKKEE